MKSNVPRSALFLSERPLSLTARKPSDQIAALQAGMELIHQL
jgi:hypothetical protein